MDSNSFNQGNNMGDNWYNGQNQNNGAYQQNIPGYQQNIQNYQNNLSGYQQNVQQAYGSNTGQTMSQGLNNSRMNNQYQQPQQTAQSVTPKKKSGAGKILAVLTLIIISFAVGILVGTKINEIGADKDNLVSNSEKEYDMSQDNLIKDLYIPTPGELSEVLKDLGFTQVYDGDDYVTSYDMDVDYRIYADKKSANINFDAYLDKSRALMENPHDKSKNHYSVLEVTETEINGCKVATVKKDYHNKNCEHWDPATKPEYLVETYILKENTLLYYAASSDSNWIKQTLAFTLESALKNIGYIDLNTEAKVE